MHTHFEDLCGSQIIHFWSHTLLEWRYLLYIAIEMQAQFEFNHTSNVFASVLVEELAFEFFYRSCLLLCLIKSLLNNMQL